LAALDSQPPPSGEVDDAVRSRLLRQRQSVIHLDSQVADGALQLSMTNEQLAGTQIAGQRHHSERQAA
jgi:hypothetical protein